MSTDFEMKVLNFMESFDKRLSNFEEKFDKLEERFDKLEERFDKLEGRFDKLEGRVDQIEGKINNQIETNLISIINNQVKMMKQIEEIKNNFKEHEIENEIQFNQINYEISKLKAAKA